MCQTALELTLTEDNLELLVFLPHLLSSGLTGLNHCVQFMWE